MLSRTRAAWHFGWAGIPARLAEKRLIRVKLPSPSAKIGLMSSDTRELIEICDQLPQAKRVEVTDFARFLLAQQGDQR
jgi:hypothetical protein